MCFFYLCVFSDSWFMLMALMELLTTIVETCWNHKLGIIAEIWNKDAVWHENPACKQTKIISIHISAVFGDPFMYYPGR